MKLLLNGKLPLVVLALLLSACKSSTPPVIEICILDGFGGGDCVEHDSSKLYRSPSQMKNYWCTNQEDMQAFASWAYNEDKAN